MRVTNFSSIIQSLLAGKAAGAFFEGAEAKEKRLGEEKFRNDMDIVNLREQRNKTDLADIKEQDRYYGITEENKYDTTEDNPDMSQGELNWRWEREDRVMENSLELDAINISKQALFTEQLKRRGFDEMKNTYRNGKWEDE